MDGNEAPNTKYERVRGMEWGWGRNSRAWPSGVPDRQYFLFMFTRVRAGEGCGADRVLKAACQHEDGRSSCLPHPPTFPPL